ncbi:DUF2637 domain-containing protein [Nonomuraea sp. B19D2]|uniref:DUF2637 domain-containing protein n=1 Tax=Nonomuraea sp. B19D2 TaxID=3159561 RepID=UPI0032DA0BB6
MTAYWDTKAARTVAAADAETRLAEAEATRAETMLRVEAQRMELQARQAEQAEQARVERQERKAQARRARRAARRARRQERRALLGKATRAAAGAVSERAPLLVGAVAMGAPIAIAWDGQLEFGEQVMKLGPLAATVPVALEGSAWYLAWLTHQALEAEKPTARLRVWTWLLALTAAAMNVWHGVATQAFGDDGLQVGIVRGLASLLGVGLWELTVMARRQRKSGRSLAELRTALWRRVRYPRLSWQAASIAAARGSACSPDQAWEAAWIDRYGVGPDASHRDRRLARRIQNRQARADRQAAKKGQLSMVGGLVIGRPIPIVPVNRPEPMPVVPMPAASIESLEARVDRPDPLPIEAGPADRVPARRSIESPAAESAQPRSIEGTPTEGTSIEALAAPAVPVIGKPAVSGGSSAARSAQAVRRQIEAPAARRSIDEHRAVLAVAIEAGRIDPRPSAEAIRKALRCAPSIARQLRDEIAEGVAA